MEEYIFRKIFKEYEKQLKNLFEPHRKLIICFAGVPGSGKTYLAKNLKKDIKA